VITLVVEGGQMHVSQIQMPPDGRMGMVMVFQDEKSGISVNVPSEMAAAPQLIKALASMITPDQKKELAPLFNGGLYLPGDGVPPNFKAGPQG